MGADALPLPRLSDGMRSELEAQFERLLEANRASLSRLAWSYTDTAADREDLLQDIAVALWRALPNFRGECSERTFVYRIAHNRALHAIARRRTSTSDSEHTETVADPAPTAEATITRQQETRQLADAVRQLPQPYRQVVVLVLEGLEYSEVAEILGISGKQRGRAPEPRPTDAARHHGRTKMIVDKELQAWQQDWTSITPDVPDLSVRVKRQTRWMKWMLASEVLVTVNHRRRNRGSRDPQCRGRHDRAGSGHLGISRGSVGIRHLDAPRCLDTRLIDDRRLPADHGTS